MSKKKSHDKQEKTDSAGGKIIRRGKRFSIVEASPDDPIYTRGFVIGGHYSGRRTFNDLGKTAINNSNEKIPDKNDATPNQEEE